MLLLVFRRSPGRGLRRRSRCGGCHLGRDAARTPVMSPAPRRTQKRRRPPGVPTRTTAAATLASR